MVAAPRSGAGKTTVAVGLIAALGRRGRRVGALKCGPDYIDPAFHAAASGTDCANIDSWAMSPGHVAQVLRSAAEPGGVLVIESAMGLFDGVAGRDGRSGAASDVAVGFGIPVVLVIDIAGQGRSAGAVAAGFAAFDPRLELGGAILNGVASERHLRTASEGLAAAGIARLGWLPRHPDLAFPDRHLGLVQARERRDLAQRVDALAGQVAETVDLDRIEALARAPAVGPRGASFDTRPLDPPGQRIALADDAAFSFFYPQMAAGWRRQGAEIVRFSPLADEPPPPGCDCCWLPGGYPELHAGRIAAAGKFLGGLREFAETRPVHGECGGYMVLGQALEDADGNTHRMAGLMGHSTSFRERRLHLGYRRAVTAADCVLGGAGTAVRGHEFHYATMRDAAADQSFLDLFDGEGRALGPGGGRRGNVTGTFFHAIARER
ncbi:MAG: cobyrinate a,c-diamide synthase [Defluviicoccus sp.]|nr:cobyrinate a,c-diamide synthase [Defluviicoccus sp.]MDE0382839.1 cobyrinate a,c-diamide synthase [Defluviicoccus sp.]